MSKAGERYLPQCQNALDTLDNAKINIQQDAENINGEIWLTASSDFGRNLLTPWLNSFMQQHPQLKVRLHLCDSTIDFYRDPVDSALRYGPVTDSAQCGFKICDVPRIVCASPSYLEEHGTPNHPSDLQQHNGLLYQLYDGVHDTWVFYRINDSNTEHKIKMSSNRISNDGDLVKRWCVAGKGVAVKSCLDVSAEL